MQREYYLNVYSGNFRGDIGFAKAFGCKIKEASLSTDPFVVDLIVALADSVRRCLVD